MTDSLGLEMPIPEVEPQAIAPSPEQVLKDGLRWALVRLSQLQGGRLDPIRLKEGIDRLADSRKPMQQLADICQALGKNSPKLLKTQDRPLVPMLALHPSEGWGVIVDRAADGRWILQTSKGAVPVSQASLDRACAVVQLGPKINLALGLFAQHEGPVTFFSHVRETLTLFLHR